LSIFQFFFESLKLSITYFSGTLTSNKMSVRAIYTAESNIVLSNPTVKLGNYLKDQSIPDETKDLIATLIAIDTMNETVLSFKEDGSSEGGQGNPTEVALLTLTHDMGFDYEEIRNTTKGRSSVGKLGEFLANGKLFGFSSARKMMSWAVPLDGGGYRIYSKGAQEVILSRCDRFVATDGEAKDMTGDIAAIFADTSQQYSRRGMRCLALAYADLPEGTDLEKVSDKVKNADGSEALEAETGLIAVALVGIEDPLRPEVPLAIEKCYAAGIDVRMVTGDNPNTAVSIAYYAGILRDSHFREGATEKVADNLKENVLMTGPAFRGRVYRESEGRMEFQQFEFDRIWPHLRVLARSSPDDKLTLAHGLNQSTLFADKAACTKLLKEHDIKIFPDRQVIAMTGDGTNDAPALKRADIGFAMGIAGTQIAKDAADIILLDDNFASIVTAAKWGRNVYASIQKFLQFQLTVNVSAVVTALVGSFYVQKSPLAAIQLLWVNLLMDSLASLALASEPPVDALLEKPPVNRTESMITNRMWANMLGQATYQIIAVMVLLFEGPRILEINEGHIDEKDGVNSVHYTLIFNAFVWMQLFNEVNCRKLKGECKFNDTERENGTLLLLTRVPLQQAMCFLEY
jgi:Ca2+ transporting ATPase